jgi:phospholipid/cholesterol/gamma-HCH transport system substrate-binding protein
MPKTAPSLGRILMMAFFALSCFGLLLFLWLSFGGPVPLKPQGYRFQVAFPEATTLAEEADVRMAGVNIGKVKKKELDKRGAATKVEVEVDRKFAPIPADTRAILRQKTLLGETFVELTPGSRQAPKLDDGGTLKRSQVESTVELDEIFRAFDEPTRNDYRNWVKGSAGAIDGASEDLNDALGNLEGFSRDGADVLRVLDEQEQGVKRLIRNTGVVFGAINEREGALRQLIVNSDNVFQATASRDDALAETFRTFPTFLDESRATLARLETFSRDTHPLVRDLKPVADDLGPTVRDVGRLAPDLRNLFRDLDPLITASKTGLPAAERFLRGAEPVFEGMHVFLPELNPVLSYLNFHSDTVAHFIGNSAGANTLAGGGTDGPHEQIGDHYFPQMGVINSNGLSLNRSRPAFERGNAYVQPNAIERLRPLGAFEAFDCSNTPSKGEVRDPSDNPEAPPCILAPPSLFDNRIYNRVEKGNAPLRPMPRGFDGTKPPTLP